MGGTIENQRNGKGVKEEERAVDVETKENQQIKISHKTGEKTGVDGGMVERTSGGTVERTGRNDERKKKIHWGQ